MYDHLKLQAARLRRQTFEAFVEAGEAHLGGSFSMIEMLIALYEEVLGVDDKFILSKAHASFPLCLLLRQKGMRPKLTTHLERDPENGIHCTTESLGHGLPMATGMAMAKKRLIDAGKIFVMISDGECQEGTTWESLLIAAKHQLENLVVLVDYNKIQALSRLDEALPLGDLAAKFRAFEWDCEEVIDGHSFEELVPGLMRAAHGESLRPRALIVHTIKGKGIPSFEDDPAWHARKVKGEYLEVGKKELGLL